MASIPTPGDDVIKGTAGVDQINGLAGNTDNDSAAEFQIQLKGADLGLTASDFFL